MHERIEIGDLTFLTDGGEEFGSVMAVSKAGLRIYVENAGEFDVPLGAVSGVHSKKVILDLAKLDPKLKRAIRHAHDAEDPSA